MIKIDAVGDESWETRLIQGLRRQGDFWKLWICTWESRNDDAPVDLGRLTIAGRRNLLMRAWGLLVVVWVDGRRETRAALVKLQAAESERVN